jgi:hypothetical protein
MTHDVPPERQDKARALFGDLIAGRWEKAHQEFDVSMRGHADTQRIARGWTHLADRAGSFERMGAPAALYRFRTRCRGCDLLLGRVSRLRQGRGLCVLACST